MLEHAHIPRALAHDRGDLVDLEPAQHPEQNHLGLLSLQARPNERDGGVGANHVEGKAGWIIRGGTLAQDLR